MLLSVVLEASLASCVFKGSFVDIGVLRVAWFYVYLLGLIREMIGYQLQNH